jgi:hypothetical protein
MSYIKYHVEPIRSAMKYIILIFTLFCYSDAWALRCGNDLIAKGDRKIEVLKACGEPTLIDTWEEESVAFRGNEAVVIGEKGINAVELWTYNFGPMRFMQFLRFVNGRLEDITVGPHGFSETALSKKATLKCGNLISVGDRKIEVMAKCGKPATTDSHNVERVIKRKDNRGAVVSGSKLHINVEEWTYNFGPQKFLLFITMENGVVVSVESGDYGF